MVLLRNSIKLITVMAFLSTTTTVYADNYDSKTYAIIKSLDKNILQEILDLAYTLGVELGLAIKIYFKGN